MTPRREELAHRAHQYTQRYGLALGDELGFGIHGIVYATENHPETEQSRLRSAIKVHEHHPAYCRERDVYLRLKRRGVREIRDCEVPQLLRYDDELWIIEMTVVTRPFVLDFAAAYLDQPPEFSEEVLADWRGEKQEQFGPHWTEVQAILRSLEGYGVFMVDVNPGNISFAE